MNYTDPDLFLQFIFVGDVVGANAGDLVGEANLRRGRRVAVLLRPVVDDAISVSVSIGVVGPHRTR